MKLAKRIERIKPSSIIKIADEVREMERRGRQIVRLEIGEPHFSTPKVAIRAVVKALNHGLTHYSHSRGLFELRDLLCKKYNTKFGIKLDPKKNILITPGGKQALFYVILSIIEEGDEVIIPAPGWVSYKEIVRLAGGTPVFAECKKNENFDLFFESIKSKITKRTKAVILNSPNNPTGRIIRKNVLQKINSVCLKNEIVLISDEIYNEILFAKKKYCSILSINPRLKNCVLINGFSKTYAMTGWRLGYVFAEQKLIEAMLKLQQNSISCPSTFIQFGAVAVLLKGKDFIKKSLKIYQKNRDLLIREFRKIDKFRLIEPEGGLYAFIDASKVNRSSYDFCRALLKEECLATIPGAAFGESGEGCFRICLATEKNNILKFTKKLQSLQNLTV